MIHEVCGKSHRSPEAEASCQAKYERARARQAKLDAEILRREKNLKAHPPTRLVFERRKIGGADGTWERIVTSLNRDYPPPPHGGKWNVWDAVSLYVPVLKWPVPDEVAIQMILEKHYLGEYLTLHPLSLPGVMDGIRASDAVMPEDIVRATVQEGAEDYVDS